MHTGEKRVQRQGLTVIDCETCGYAHLDPLPDASEVDAWYRADKFYREHSPPGWLERERREAEEGLWDTRFLFELSLLAPTLPVLDIGASTGSFVKRARAFGWEAYGVEPSALARGEQAWLYSDLSTARAVIGERYVNVRASLVLEHLVDVRGALEEWKGLAGDEGHILIVVPNEFNFLQVALKTKHFVSRVHVNYFTGESLSRVCRAVGLRTIFRGATFPMEVFLFGGLDYRKDDKLGEVLHRSRLEFEARLGRAAFEYYAQLHRAYGIGRELLYVFQKELD